MGRAARRARGAFSLSPSLSLSLIPSLLSPPLSPTNLATPSSPFRGDALDGSQELSRAVGHLRVQAFGFRFSVLALPISGFEFRVSGFGVVLQI